MSDLRIPRGQTVKLDVVDGEVQIGNNATIEASNGKKVTVTKGVYLEGKAYVNCDLECESLEPKTFLSKEINMLSGKARLDLTGRYPGKLEVNGNLTVHKKLSVGHSVEVKGLVKAEEIDVGGKVDAGAVSCGRIRVGGRADVKGALEASSVNVGGKIVAGIVKLGDLDVGGEAEVEGGSITGHIRVGGKFISKTALEFGELLVYGRGFLPANCKGHRLSTFGKIDIAGNFSCDQIQVGGSVEIQGDCHADKLEVGGKFEVAGSLFIADRFEGSGLTTINSDFEGTNLRVSGKFQANKITVKQEADLSGRIEAKQGLKAKLLTVRTGSQCEGVLIAERVEIGKSSDVSWGAWSNNWATKWAAAGAGARVDDVYAHEVVLGPMCRAAAIVADIVRLEQGSAAEQVMYTTELKMDLGAAISQPPRKVVDLPKPPF